MPAKKSAGGQPRAISIPYSPPAGAVRQATGQVLPSTPGGWFNALLGVGVGVVVATVIPGLMPVSEKWAGAAVTGLLGLVLMVTSPVASIAQEAGIGAVGASAAYFYYDLSGQICSPNSNQ